VDCGDPQPVHEDFLAESLGGSGRQHLILIPVDPIAPGKRASIDQTYLSNLSLFE